MGVEGEGRLIKMFAIGPKMTVGVLAASYDVGDFLSAIVDGIAPVESKFLDVQRFVFPIGEVIQIEFFVVNGFHTNEIGL